MTTQSKKNHGITDQKFIVRKTVYTIVIRSWGCKLIFPAEHQLLVTEKN